jgi:hypothetical protein
LGVEIPHYATQESAALRKVRLMPTAGEEAKYRPDTKGDCHGLIRMAADDPVGRVHAVDRAILHAGPDSFAFVEGGRKAFACFNHVLFGDVCCGCEQDACILAEVFKGFGE